MHQRRVTAALSLKAGGSFTLVLAGDGPGYNWRGRWIADHDDLFLVREDKWINFGQGHRRAAWVTREHGTLVFQRNFVFKPVLDNAVFVRE